MLVYRGMDVGTAKPTSDERAHVPHHLLDLAEPSEPFSVARYQALGRTALAGIETRGRPALLTGGSGLYFRALVDDLEFPGTDTTTRGELEAEASAVGGDALYRRLAEIGPDRRRQDRAGERAPHDPGPGGRGHHRPAVQQLRRGMGALPGRSGARRGGPAGPQRRSGRGSALASSAWWRAAWLDEVRGLVERGFGGWLTSTQAIGYAEFAAHLRGRLTLDEAVERTVSRTRQLARRQVAWFRRDPRIRWFEAGEGGALDVLEDVRAYLAEGTGSA